jgi:hypothetical protein
MDIDIEEVAKHYAELNDEELLRVHASGSPTEFAYDVLEKEMIQRGIPIPQRPEKPKGSSVNYMPGSVAPLIYFFMWVFWFSISYGVAESVSDNDTTLNYMAYIVPTFVGGILFGRYFKRWWIHVLIASSLISAMAVLLLMIQPMGQEGMLILQVVLSILSGFLGAQLGLLMRKEKLENNQ